MDRYLSCAMDIGEQMLKSGAEVHRVEDSIKRMCNSFGFTRIDVFIIPSSMVATVYNENGETYTQTRRIVSSATDFEKLHKLNALSRKLCSKKHTIEEIESEIKQALNCKKYPFYIECICYSLIAGMFTLFFGGSVIEMFVSLFAGLIVRFVITLCKKTVPNYIFSKFCSSVTASAIAFSAMKIGIVSNVDTIIIGNIMTLIPGIGLTNALRDLFTGDSIAGLLRCIEAILIALAIALGYFLVALLGGVSS